MRHWILFTFLILLTGCQTLVARFMLPNKEVREAYGLTIQRDLGFLTSDGIRLSSDVYRPQTASATPAILVRIPVTKTFMNSIRVDAAGRFWARRGYGTSCVAT